MDRQNARGVPFAAAVESSSSGWDAHRVWRERVHVARRSPSTETPIELMSESAGWDPLETWRIRVRAPRHSTK